MEMKIEKLSRTTVLMFKICYFKLIEHYDRRKKAISSINDAKHTQTKGKLCYGKLPHIKGMPAN